MGVRERDDGTLDLEEKGTVYNEMVSSTSMRWHDLYRQLGRSLYGDTHPLALSSGGLPSAIRTMQPEDIRRFHSSTHHLNNMGVILALGKEVSLDHAVEEMSRILETVEPEATEGNDPLEAMERLPPPDPAPAGRIDQVRFPHKSPDEAGLLVYAWPATLNPDEEDELILDLFFELLASGDTSNLHRLFIDSKTRIRETGATSVFTWLDDDLGHPVFVGLDNVDAKRLTKGTISAIRDEILAEVRKIRDMEAGSEELKAFNERAKGVLMLARRARRKFLNSPPRFGFRGISSEWLELLETLTRAGGFERDLSQSETLDKVEARLATDENFWRPRVDRWKLLENIPYATATTADPTQIEREEAERKSRIMDFVSALKTKHHVDADGKAILAYKDEYDAATAIIETEAAKMELPSFVENPPLSLDPNLNYASETLAGKAPFVYTTFDNVTSVSATLAFNLRATPENLSMYLSTLPILMRRVGVVVEEGPLAYNEFEEKLRTEILSLDVDLSTSAATRRAELVISGLGSVREEGEKVLFWMQTLFTSSDLSIGNLARIRDAIDSHLGDLRNTMKGSEESWVNDPADAYWRQSDAILLHAGSAFSRTYDLLRFRWQLKQASPADRAKLEIALAPIGEWARTLNREDLDARLAQMTIRPTSTNPEKGNPSAQSTSTEDDTADKLIVEVTEDLRKHLGEIPADSLAADVPTLMTRIMKDLDLEPGTALQRVRDLRDRLLHGDNVRVTFISNKKDREALRPGLESLVASLNSTPTEVPEQKNVDIIDERVRERNPTMDRPLFVGLVNPNTRSGVHILSANCASLEDTDEPLLLDYLAAQTFAGGGAHSLFMKTWGAGLAYSNGIRPSIESGRLRYYAERCPDLPQTLQFVIKTIEAGADGTDLASYAVAQAFSRSRAGDPYESRGRAMATDLADGRGPEMVERFRKAILVLNKREDLKKTLTERLQKVYGRVLPGMDPSSKEASRDHGALYFVIGPEDQMKSWQSYLERVENEAQVVRIYPRDFWHEP